MGRELRDLTLAVVAASRPVRSAGGPSRVAYEMLRWILTPREAPGRRFRSVLFVSSSDWKIFRLRGLDDLERVSAENYERAVSMHSFGAIHKLIIKTYGIPLISGVSMRLSGKGNVLLLKLAEKKSAKLLDDAIFHFHCVPASFSSWRRPFGAKVVWTEHSKGGVLSEREQLHGRPVDEYIRKMYEESYAAAVSVADVVVFPSAGALRLFEEKTGLVVPRSKLRIVYNGVPDPLCTASRSEPVTREDGLIVTVAEHVPEKGLDVALEALVRVRRPWRWVVVGRFSSWTDKLRSDIERLRLGNKVEFVGPLPHEKAIDWMLRADLVLVTSRVAVFDLALLEAMALGKAIISTPVGGNVEALGEDYGLFGRDPTELATLVDSLTKEVADAVGRRNRSVYERRFTIESMAQAYVSLYQELCR